MEPGRFDRVSKSLAEFHSSRRSLLGGLGAGGLAAIIAALGLTAGGADDVEAKSCRKRCKHKKNRSRCLQRCKKGSTSNPITFNVSLLGINCSTDASVCGSNTGLSCAAGVCAPTDLGSACNQDKNCSTGQCDPNTHTCVQCTEICGNTGDEVCCVVGAQCLGAACVVS